MRNAKPWFRQQNQTWYVWHNGKQVKLGKDEERAKAKHRALIRRGAPLADQTVRQVLAAYAKAAKRKLAESTYDRRRPILQSFIDFIPPTLAAEDLKPYHVERWLVANGKVKVYKGTGDARRIVKTAKHISPTTEGTRIGIIQAALSWAASMGYVTASPIAKMKKPAARIRQDFLPADTWLKVLALATDDRFRELLAFMLATGCRTTELRKFEASHLDGERFVFPIEESKGKQRSRVVYPPAEALAIVRRLAEQHPEGPIFRNRKGKPWTRNAIRCRFRYFKAKLKLPELTATTLRHSFAHYRLTSGQDALTVAKLMGHRDTTMLARRYGHLEDNAAFMANAANQVAFPTLPVVGGDQPVSL